MDGGMDGWMNEDCTLTAVLTQDGLGVAKPTNLLVTQDFFAELRLPYSVKRGETFPLNVTLFNYLDVSRSRRGHCRM